MEKRLTLQPRLKLLADLVPQGARLADVGTDHGYVPVYLLQNGRIASAIASDINELPLAHARRTAEEYGVKRISFTLCAGLERITPNECDTILIAGMGGETIIDILSAAPWTRSGRHMLLLQPQTKTELLRAWLCDEGYAIKREYLVEDKGKLYVVLECMPGEPHTLSAAEAYGGVALHGDALYPRYLDAQIKKLRLRAEGLRAGGREVDEAFTKTLRELEEKRELIRHANGFYD